MMWIPGKRILVGLEAAVLVVGMGCASRTSSKQAPPPSPMTKERLAIRVAEFWTAWQEHDLHRVFLLYSPSYRRKTTEPAFYEVTRGMLGINPQEYEIKAVEMSDGGRSAKVSIDSFAIIPPVGRVLSKLEQKWVYEEGDWYRVMDPFSSPPSPPPGAVAQPSASPR